MTREEFDLQLARLIGLRGMPGDTEGHWEVLQHVSISDLSRGVAQALRTRSWYPAPAELLADVEQARPRDTWRSERTTGPWRQAFDIPNPFGGEPLHIPAGREWEQKCEDCGDTGWLTNWCGEPGPSRKPWQPLDACQRTEEHLPHEWVGQCHCWATNTKLIRKRDSMAQHARGGKQERGSAA